MTDRASPFLRDIALTFATSVLVSLSSVISTPMLAHGMGAREFGTLSLARRLVFWASAVSSMDMAVALARHLGTSRGDAIRSREYLVAAISIVAACSVVSVAIGLMFAEALGQTLLGSPHGASLVRVSLAMMAGYSCYGLAYSYYRGVGSMWKANLLQLVLLGGGALGVAWFFASHGAVAVVTATGILYSLAAVTFVATVWRRRERHIDLGGVRSAVLELVRYGSPRVLAGFSYQGILAIGPVIAAMSSLANVAYLTLAQITFMVLETVFGSFGIVALPRVAQLSVGKQSADYLRAGATDALLFVIQVGVFGTLHALVWADVIVHAWLGTLFEPVIPQLRIVMLALTPYVAYTLLRSVIDGVEPRPVNAMNLIVALATAGVVGIGLTWLGMGPISASIGVTVALWVLGILTVRFLITRFDIHLSFRRVCLTVAVNVFIVAIAAAAHTWAIGLTGGSLGQLAVGAVATATAGVAYLGWLHHQGTEWLSRLHLAIARWLS